MEQNLAGSQIPVEQLSQSDYSPEFCKTEFDNILVRGQNEVVCWNNLEIEHLVLFCL